jgi:hypothetical protein
MCLQMLLQIPSIKFNKLRPSVLQLLRSDTWADMVHSCNFHCRRRAERLPHDTWQSFRVYCKMYSGADAWRCRQRLRHLAPRRYTECHKDSDLSFSRWWTGVTAEFVDFCLILGRSWLQISVRTRAILTGFSWFSAVPPGKFQDGTSN